MNNPETHLFILWEKSLYKKDEIISEIKEKFKILKIYKMKWSEKYFLSNLSRFYGTNLPNCEAKAEHCGKGEFLLIIVKDENPNYEERDTSKGTKIVNTKLFDCKEKFRRITGGGHKIHATNDEVETNHDITLLLGKNIEDFVKENNEEWDDKIENLQKDLCGYDGWKNAQEMFYVLNNCIKYAVLRNYEGLPEEIYVNEHNDIDIICDSIENCACILNAERTFAQQYRVNYKAKVEDKIANFDLRFVGDNYYYEPLEQRLLENRKFNENGFYVLDNNDYFYTLLYHALIHKTIFKEDYKTRLIKMNDRVLNENSNTDDMINVLKEWLIKNKYLVTVPNDKSVDFNMENAIKFKPILQLENQNNQYDLFNDNILKWYPIDENKKILLIGDNIKIEEYLKENDNNLVTIGRFENIDIKVKDNKFDYIIIYGMENYDKSILKIKENLSEIGKIIVIGNNHFGITNWNKYNFKFGINQINNERTNKQNIKMIRKMLNENGLDNTNTFYCFPNYKETEVLISEKYKIDSSQIDRYRETINPGDIVIYDEIKTLKEVIKEDTRMLDFFANSYLIEASKNKIDTDIKYVSYNNCRNEKYRLITLIRENVAEKIVENKNAVMHLENMKQAIKDIKNIYGEKIQILDFEENGKVYSKLEKEEKTLDRIFTENYQNQDEIVKILNDFKAILLENAVSYEQCKDKVEKLEQPEELLEKLHYMPKAFWDMVSKNCFYINSKFVFFDQEWTKEYLPAEFIIYRSIINSYDLVRKIDVDKLFGKLNILPFKSYFEKIDQNIRKDIIDSDIFDKMYCKQGEDIEKVVTENIMNKEYINKLENQIIPEIREDNDKKQQYITGLENKIKELENNNGYKKRILGKLKRILSK